MISKFGYKGTAFLQYRRENHDIPFYLTYFFLITLFLFADNQQVIASLYFSCIYFFIFVPFVRPHLLFASSGVARCPPCFFLCKVMAALPDAKYQERTPYLAKTFLEAFRKYCIFGYSRKVSTKFLGVLTSLGCHPFCT